MGDSSSSAWEKSRNHTDMVELTGKVMVVSIILLIFVVIFFFCLHLYFKWFFHQREIAAATTTRRRRSRRLDFSAGHHEIVVTPTSHSHIGLEPSIHKSIPVVSFNHDDFKDGLECAVCLCEVCDGEKARILPKCSHGFHVECIDMWFQSHATCPLCRSPISDQKPFDGQDYSSDMGPNLPTNVLLWGDETRVNSLGPCVEDDHAAEPSMSATTSASGRSDGVVVIDIVGESTNS